MASQSSYEFYKDNIKQLPPLRTIADTLVLDHKIRTVTPAEAYELARRQWDVQETDLEIYPPAAKRLGLPKGARVLNNVHGKIIGRTAKARRFWHALNDSERKKVSGDLLEAISDLQRRPLIKAHAIIGLDQDLMIKATIVGTEDDAANIFNWLVNFTPYEELAEKYENSPKLPIQDIIVIADNEWRNNDPFYHNQGFPQLALVDVNANVIFNFGMRYFGERKKGTLTLAWTSGMRLGMAACHGGIKEIDFTKCEEEVCQGLGKRSIAFFGLSGTGKSSHTNSSDNGGTMPKGFGKVVLHDDAFQIDIKEKICRVWEPTLFDKTDSRPIGHPDWNYIISVMNHGQIMVDGKNLPVGQDLRNGNGRCLLDRSLLGTYVNRCSFPSTLCWLTKDTTMPPIMRFADVKLAVAMGASLMTRRNVAENVSEEELKKLVFVPFANPFRVYELWKDVEAFIKVFENGASGYMFNSSGFWKTSADDVTTIPLQSSLTLQTAILTDRLEWEDWPLMAGAQVPTRESVNKILPGFYERYDHQNVENHNQYLETLRDRVQQRKDFLQNSDLQDKPELLAELTKSLHTM